MFKHLTESRESPISNVDCKYSIEENEEIVNWLVKEFDYTLLNIDADLDRGINMPQSVRLYPHKVRGEGQFVAVLKKNEPNGLISSSSLKLSRDKTAENFISKTLNKDYQVYEFNNNSYYISDLSMIKKNVNYIIRKRF